MTRVHVASCTCMRGKHGVVKVDVVMRGCERPLLANVFNNIIANNVININF